MLTDVNKLLKKKMEMQSRSVDMAFTDQVSDNNEIQEVTYVTPILATGAETSRQLIDYLQKKLTGKYFDNLINRYLLSKMPPNIAGSSLSGERTLFFLWF